MKVKEIPVSLLNQLRLTFDTKKGLTKGKPIIPVVVSLASIPSRLGIVHLTIKSIFNQDVLPEKIILWLHEDLKTEIPQKLAKLTGDLFSIKYTSYSSSHRKLVEPLKIFGDKIVVTCDDDMIYRKRWLSRLYECHQKKPTAIIGNQTRCISYSDSGELLPYREWKSSSESCENAKRTLPIGAGGTLYPPNTLDDLVFDQKLFLDLAPKADDLWFKAMALLKGTISIQAENNGKEPIPIWGSQKVSLKKSNITEDKNRTQWLALSQHFKLKLHSID